MAVRLSGCRSRFFAAGNIGRFKIMFASELNENSGGIFVVCCERVLAIKTALFCNLLKNKYKIKIQNIYFN